MSNFNPAALLTDLRGPDVSPHDCSALLHPQPTGARICLEILRPQPKRDGRHAFEILERHERSAQVFLPLGVASWIHAVAPCLSDGSPNLRDLHWRIAGGTSGIIIHPNTWHAPLMILEPGGAVAMMMWRLDPRRDSDVWHLPTPIPIHVGNHELKSHTDGSWRRADEGAMD